MRSGSTTSPKDACLFWMGDQLVTYDSFDGLQSALIGLLNGGWSGFSIGHSDIGGYTTISQGPVDKVHYRRDPELLKRWIEMSTFSDAIFRTHPSLDPAYSAQVYDNEDMA